MSSRISVLPDSLDWKQSYMTAIFEKDRARMPGLIAAAREKLALRLGELGDLGFVQCDEIDAIHDALYMLEALRDSLAYREESA